MKVVIAIGLLFASGIAAAFSSASWLEERNDDSDVQRLRVAYTNCVANLLQPAQNVVLPLETFPDGQVKSRLMAAEAQMFLDTGFIWGRGIRVEEYNSAGEVKGRLVADSCIVDRSTRTGWVEGVATLTYGGSMVKGTGVYFSFDREFIKIFSQSEIRSKGLKTNPRSLL